MKSAVEIFFDEISSRNLGFQKLFTAKFGHFLVTIFIYNYFLGKFFFQKNNLKKKSRVPGFQIPVLEKNPGYTVPGFQIPVLETVYRDSIIKKMFRALRAHPKPLLASYGTFKTGCCWGEFAVDSWGALNMYVLSPYAYMKIFA